MFPCIDPTAPLLRRGPGEVQFGVGPHEAVILTGLSDREIDELERLDGSRHLSALERSGASPRLSPIVRELAGLGLVVDAHEAADPGVGSVLVDGDGVLALAIAGILRQNGVRVHMGRAALDAMDFAARTQDDGCSPGSVDLIVRTAIGAVSPLDPSEAHGAPVLPVLLCTRTAVVGPLLTVGGPCPRCLDLTRADLDPAWAHTLAQLGGLPEPETLTPLTALAAASTAAAALHHLRPSPLSEGVGGAEHESVEISLTPPRLVRRRWAVHPRCRHTPGPSAPVRS